MKNKLLYTFCRVEKKYILNEEDHSEFIKRIQPYMEQDMYGLSTICNIYFDSENNDMIRTSLDKPRYKEKIRMRSYGVPKANDMVFIELKKKYNGVVFKRRVSLRYFEALEYFKTGKKPAGDSQIFREIDYAMQFYKPSPKLYLAYDRIAYAAKDNSGVRMTVDTNIRSRDINLSLDEGSYGSPVIDKNLYLLEIKVLDAYPMWLIQILSEMKLYPASFSKYGKVYTDEVRRSLYV